MKKFRRSIFSFLSLLLLMLMSSTVLVHAQNVTQGYGVDATLERGMIVQLKSSDPSKVEPLTTAHVDKLQGVIVSQNDSPVTISNEGQKVFVANSGRYDVLVSDQNGALAVGDYVTISSISGIGMKADDKIGAVVVGKALQTFNGQDNVIGTQDAKSTTGSTQKVHIGRILVDVTLGKNPLLKSEESTLPQALQKISDNIAGKHVGTPRVIAGLLLLILAAGISGSILYAGVHSSIIAIGRNPLGKKAIMRSLLQVTLTSMIILVLGVMGVYLLFKL